MTTFTFTDDEVEWLIEAISTADVYGAEGAKHLMACLEKLERKSSYIIGECGGPELVDIGETVVKNGAMHFGLSKEK